MEQLIESREGEAHDLEFKRELGNNNEEIAKDIAAMTVRGGVILYGIEEDRSTSSAVTVQPLAIAGLEERLQRLAAMRIAPKPVFEVVAIRDAADPALGVLAVVVPPSASGPHMTGDRYPTRRGTTTDRLSEPEVEQLYRRRFAVLAESAHSDDLLGRFQAPRPVVEGDDPSSGQVGVGRLRVAIAAPGEAVGHPGAPWLGGPLARASEEAVGVLLRRLKGDPRQFPLSELKSWTPRGSVGWTTGRSGGTNSKALSQPSAAAVALNTGSLYFQATWPLATSAAAGTEHSLRAREDEVGRAAIVFAAVAGQWFGDLPTAGPLRLSMAFEGFNGAFASNGTAGRDAPHSDTGPPRGAFDGQNGAWVHAPDLKDSPDEVVRPLVDGWIFAFLRSSEPYWEALLANPDTRT